MNNAPIQIRLSFLLSVSLVSLVSANEPPDVMIQRDLVYANVDGRALKLDLYQPVIDTKPPLVVWIHGGGWRKGSKNKALIRKIVPHGFALASIEYRFTDTATFPAQIHDCKAAVRWLRANAEQFGYDATWIAAAGSSAGGHLALMMGTSGGVAELEGSVGGNLEQSSMVQAVVDYFGPSDFVLRGETQPERAYTNLSGSFALMGGTDGQRLDVETERFASPSRYVSGDDPPLLVFHGTKDKTVRLDQSERIIKLYEDAGANAELVVLPEAGHGGKDFFIGERFEKLIDFLKANVR